MTATLNELQSQTAKLLRPVMENGQTLVITENGVPRAKIVPITGDLGEQPKATVVEQDGLIYLRRGKPITAEEVAELLADFP